jgi:hypothetical protein
MVRTIGSNQTAFATSNLSYDAVTNSLYIGGDLYIDGQQTYINRTNLATGDATLTLNTSSASAATAANSGIQVGTTSTPYASFLFDGNVSWVVSGSAATTLKSNIHYANNYMWISGSGTGTSNSGLILDYSGTVQWQLYPVTSSGRMAFSSAGTENFSLFNNGAGAGVGYTSAQQGAKLSVNGASYLNGITTSTGQLVVNPTGTPTAQLYVNQSATYSSALDLNVQSSTYYLQRYYNNSTSVGSMSVTVAGLQISSANTLTLASSGGNVTINPSGAVGVNGNYGTSGQYLQSQGSGAAATWTTVSVTSVNLTQVSSGSTPQYMVFANTSTGAATLEANGPTGLVYIPTGNKFGIGTSAPADTDSYGGNNVLDVYGPIYLRQSGSSNRMSLGTSGGISYLDITAGLGFQAQISGGTVLNLDTGGNLQLSTSWTAPQQGAKLSVQGGGYFSGIVTATTFVGAFSGGVSQVQTQANAANATNYLTFVSANNASPTAQSIYTTSTHVINPSTGYIGIGTSNLVSPLNVYATQALGGTAGNYTPVFSTQASGGTGNNVYLQEWRTRASAGTDWTTQKITSGAWVDASFNTPATSRTWYERYPNAGTQAWGDGASTFMFLNGSGYLGLGITSPSYQLVVSNAGAAGVEIHPTGGINSGAFIQAYNRSGSAYVDLTYYASQHYWTIGATEKMRLNSSGGLIIGTTTQYTTGGSAALTVYDAGAGSSPSIAVGASSSDEMYVRRLSAGNYQLQSVQSGGNAGSIQLQPYGGSVGIGTTSPGYTLQVAGSFAATTKSFVIEHPTRPGYDLRYGSLEGPENGVYVRGRLKGNKIELPDYWTKLVDPDTITVNLTPVGKHQKLYVEEIKDNVITVGNDNMFGKAVDCFYTVFGERCDVERLIVEIEKPQV